MAEEKRFLDRDGLKQALALVKTLVADTKAELQTKIDSVSTGGGTALADAKKELSDSIAAAKTELNGEIANNAKDIAANATLIANTTTSLTNTITENATTAAANLAAVKTEMTEQLNTAKQALETLIAGNKTNIEKALADAKTEIKADIAKEKLKYSVVEALPEISQADPRTVYLVKDTEPNKTEDQRNIYIEYMVIVENDVNVRYEEVGDTQLSLEEYAKTEHVEQKIADAVEETLGTVAENNYVKNDNFMTEYEVIAMFAEATIVVKPDGKYVKYDSPLAALEDAVAGEVVVVTEDIGIPADFKFTEGVTIDLNGYTMKEVASV